MPLADSTNPPFEAGRHTGIPSGWTWVALCSGLLVGCGGGTSDGSGHGWFFILTFCALAWVGFMAVKQDGMTATRFLVWLVLIFILWKGMSWTVRGVGWLFHHAGESKEGPAALVRDDASQPQPVRDPSPTVNEKTDPGSNKPAGQTSGAVAGSVSRLTTTSGASPVPTPAPVEPPVYKPSGGVALRILQEARRPAPNQGQELIVLEHRMTELEYALLAGLKKAITGTQPVEDLDHMAEDLKMVSATLRVPEDCQFNKSLEAFRAQLQGKRSEFEGKSTKVATGKSIYMDMLKEIGLMQIRADALLVRFQALKNIADTLVQDSAGWIELYRDTLNFKGEAAAREELTNLLTEKEKSISQDPQNSK